MIDKLNQVTYNDFHLNETIEPEQFDQNFKEVVAKIDAIIESLNNVTGEEGSSLVGAAPVTGVDGATIRDQIADLRGLIDQLVLNQIPDDSITLEKISPLCKPGLLSELSTTDKSSLVAALNEIKTLIGTQINSLSEATDTKIGTPASLVTTDKTNLVAAINEVFGKMGVLDNLKTNNKTNLVNAINELKSSGVAIATSATIYVSNAGNDGNTGLLADAPVQSLARAVAIAKTILATEIIISITPGTYSESIVLDGIQCQNLRLNRNGSGTVTINGTISWDNGQNMYLFGLSINGRANMTVGRYFEVLACVITGGTNACINLNYIGVVKIVNSTLSNDAGSYSAPISMTRIGAAYVNGNDITGNRCLDAYGTGSLHINGGNWTVRAGSAYMIGLYHATTCLLDSVTATLGTIPIATINASILFKSNNSITTTGADIKTYGGQAF